MSGPASIGGAPVVHLAARDAPAGAPAFLSAQVLPGRGMMLLQAQLRLPSGEVVDALHAPPVEQAARELDGGPDDFCGNRSFAFGGALLVPYANRIRGRDVPGAREIETEVDGHTVRLPRNWGGKAPGAQQYAMHGLILADRFSWDQPSPDRVRGRLEAGDFDGHWPGRAELEVEWRLAGGGLGVTVTVRNVGAVPLPMGVGWHPYFALPSGRREQARLHLAATKRVEVDDYDQVLPTGRLLDTAGTPYDFRAPEGSPLGGLYLDDCFTALERPGGAALVEVRDPAAGLGLRIASPTPEVKAVQVYAPPGESFVVVEPQFNLADPYGAEWPADVDTGMARLAPGASLAYVAEVTAFAVGNRTND